MKLTVRTDFGIRKVFSPEGAIMATFANDEGGAWAFEAFKQGLMLKTVATVGVKPEDRVSLYDEDTGKYLVGDVGQLAG